MSSNNKTQWPSRPVGEEFPLVLDTLLVTQLLLYDRRGLTPEQARRNVRALVKNHGLPTLGRRIGSALMFNKKAVLNWLENGKNSVDNNEKEDKLKLA